MQVLGCGPFTSDQKSPKQPCSNCSIQHAHCQQLPLSFEQSNDIPHNSQLEHFTPAIPLATATMHASKRMRPLQLSPPGTDISCMQGTTQAPPRSTSCTRPVGCHDLPSPKSALLEHLENHILVRPQENLLDTYGALVGVKVEGEEACESQPKPTHQRKAAGMLHLLVPVCNMQRTTNPCLLLADGLGQYACLFHASAT